jgi:hypothetical protein
MEVSYYENTEAKLMYKRLSPTEAILLQVLGRDMSKPFHHKHEKIVFPSSDRLEKDLADMKPRTAQDWEDLMNEYLQVNKVKLEMMNDLRQRRYQEGALKL